MFDKKLITQWIRDGIDENTIKNASEWGKLFVEPNNKAFYQDALTTSQIRNVFGELRRIQLNGYVNEKTSFLLLKPKLAYAVKKHRKKGIELFYQMFCLAYDAVNTTDDSIGEKNFKNLMDLMEAVLAYHKFHGGKE